MAGERVEAELSQKLHTKLPAIRDSAVSHRVATATDIRLMPLMKLLTR